MTGVKDGDSSEPNYSRLKPMDALGAGPELGFKGFELRRRALSSQLCTGFLSCRIPGGLFQGLGFAVVDPGSVLRSSSRMTGSGAAPDFFRLRCRRIFASGA